MPKSLGRQQIAECQRCGGKVPAASLQFDGRLKQLLVCPVCWDPAHPQEHPFVPLSIEGKARFPIAPEQLPASTDPVLTLVDSNVPVGLSWTTGDTSRYIIESHWLYRALGTAGEFELLGTFDYEPGTAPTYAPVYTLTAEDESATPDTTYRYRVDAVTDRGQHLRSNILTIEATAGYTPPGAVVLSLTLGTVVVPPSTFELVVEFAGGSPADFNEVHFTPVSAPGGEPIVVTHADAFFTGVLYVWDVLTPLVPGTYLMEIFFGEGESQPFDLTTDVIPNGFGYDEVGYVELEVGAIIPNEYEHANLNVVEVSTSGIPTTSNVAHLTWTESAGGTNPVEHYNLYRDIGSGYELLATVDADVFTYDDVLPDPIAFPNWAYYVTAEDDVGPSDPSNIVLARIPPTAVELTGALAPGENPVLRFVAGEVPESSYAGYQQSFGTVIFGELLGGGLPGLINGTFSIGDGLESQGGSWTHFSVSIFGAVNQDFFTRMVIPELNIDYQFADATFDNGSGDGPNSVWYWGEGFAGVTPGVTYDVYFPGSTVTDGTLVNFIAGPTGISGDVYGTYPFQGTINSLNGFLITTRFALVVDGGTLALMAAQNFFGNAQVIGPVYFDSIQITTEGGTYVFRGVDAAYDEPGPTYDASRWIWADNQGVEFIEGNTYEVIFTHPANGGFQLAWTQSNGGTNPISAYRVYRKVDAGEYEEVASTTSTTWTDFTIEDGHDYAYYVIASDGISDSPASNIVTYPPPPITITAHTVQALGDVGSGVQQPNLTMTLGGDGSLAFSELNNGSQALFVDGSLASPGESWSYVIPEGWLSAGNDPSLYEVRLTLVSETTVDMSVFLSEGTLDTWVPFASEIAEWNWNGMVMTASGYWQAEVLIEIRAVADPDTILGSATQSLLMAHTPP